MRTRGDSSWETYPSYLKTAAPRFIEVAAEHDLRATVFIVGLDADAAYHSEQFRAIADAGHEVANHSYHHRPWLHRLGESDLDEDIGKAESAIQRATGCRPIGFRGPGYSLSRDAIRVLLRRGYRYDASTLPTFIGPLARAVFLAKARLSVAERDERRRPFGNLSDGFQPLNPYFLQDEDLRLLELPVTTIPVVRTPFHFSYLMSLAEYSPGLSKLYFDFALRMCALRRVEPSLLLHPLDFLDKTDSPALEFFPAMRIPWRKKVALLQDYLNRLDTAYNIVSLREHAASLEQRDLPTRSIDDFRASGGTDNAA